MTSSRFDPLTLLTAKPAFFLHLGGIFFSIFLQYQHARHKSWINAEKNHFTAFSYGPVSLGAAFCGSAFRTLKVKSEIEMLLVSNSPIY
ncbi:MAG TPA: hypothetical protein VGO47_13100 [Chlamydiales bacterium]|nr:hypothetical protein [Chlamydiales bacterium]